MKPTPNNAGSQNWMSGLVLLALLGMTMWVGHAVRLAEVPSDSMAPTFKPGDLVMMRVDAYRHALPHRGDIIIFRDTEDNKLVIKRVVGLPGESITVWSDMVWVNRLRLDEPYATGTLRVDYPVQETLEDDELWVMGDNRSRSMDSRDYGPVKKDRIVGRAAAIIWPLGRRGRLVRPQWPAGLIGPPS